MGVTDRTGAAAKWTLRGAGRPSEGILELSGSDFVVGAFEVSPWSFQEL